MTATAGRPLDLAGVVQRFGLFSAATVVDRYSVLVERVLAAAPPLPRPEGLLESVGALLGGTAPDPSTEALVLPPTAPGRSAETSLWMHNATPSGVAAVSLRISELLSARGDTVPAAAVSLVPDRVDVPAGGACEVRLTVRVPAGQPTGHYLGLVLSSAAPDQPLTLRLEVRPPGDAGR